MLSVVDLTNVPAVPSVHDERRRDERPWLGFPSAETAGVLERSENVFNGLPSDVTFNFVGNVTLPNTVIYAISYKQHPLRV